MAFLLLSHDYMPGHGERVGGSWGTVHSSPGPEEMLPHLGHDVDCEF